MLGPQQTIRIEAAITGFDAASEAAVTLFNGNTELGELRGTAIDVPLNIAIEGEGASNKNLGYTENTGATLTLKNGDAEAYPLKWQLLLDGRVIGESTTRIPPDGIARIPLPPNPDAYSWTDWVHPATKTATLILQLQGPEKFPQEMLPERALPVTLAMSPSSPLWTYARSYFYVAFVLFLGGILSHCSAVPSCQTCSRRSPCAASWATLQIAPAASAPESIPI